MATNTSTAAPTNAANAIATWAGFVETCIVTTAGWTVTADTGQTAPAALTTPGAINTSAGYRVYSSATLSGMTMFLKVEYGSSNTAASSPAMWWTVGTGSNGTGSITGTLINRVQLSSSTAAATLFTSYFSGDSARLQFGLWAGDNINTVAFATATNQIFVTLERTKNSSGADTNAGVYMGWQTCQGGTGVGAGSNNMGSLTTQTIPILEDLFRTSLNSTNTTMNQGNTGGVSLPIYFSPAPNYAGLGVVLGWAADIAKYSQFNVTLYGVAHNYIWIPATTASIGQSGSVASGTGVWGLRYE